MSYAIKMPKYNISDILYLTKLDSTGILEEISIEGVTKTNAGKVQYWLKIKDNDELVCCDENDVRALTKKELELYNLRKEAEV